MGLFLPLSPTFVGLKRVKRVKRGQGSKRAQAVMWCAAGFGAIAPQEYLLPLYGIVTTLPEASVWNNHMLAIEDQYRVVVRGYSRSVPALQSFLSLHLYVLQEHALTHPSVSHMENMTTSQVYRYGVDERTICTNKGHHKISETWCGDD